HALEPDADLPHDRRRPGDARRGDRDVVVDGVRREVGAEAVELVRVEVRPEATDEGDVVRDARHVRGDHSAEARRDATRLWREEYVAWYAERLGPPRVHRPAAEVVRDGDGGRSEGSTARPRDGRLVAD